ncbi:hypothetical protein [Peribacillus frigoritolerans]|uniref:hypothetical protein n=1 Tax=Peribacillus frigoritolerans TaxID=450367 RepID=UPI0033057B9F
MMGKVNLANQTILDRGKREKNATSPFISLPYRFHDYKETLLDQQKHYSEPFIIRKNMPLNPCGLHKIFKEILEPADLPRSPIFSASFKAYFCYLTIKNLQISYVSVGSLSVFNSNKDKYFHSITLIPTYRSINMPL